MGTSQVDPALSAKRREAGRRGAQARWASRNRQPVPASEWRRGLEAWREQRPEGEPGWRIENAASPAAELYIYDEISAFWGITARDVTAALMAVTADTITVHINSPGGDIFEAHAIYNALVNHAATVNVVIDGLAASAASYIALAGDSVEIASNASVMIHDASTVTYGNAADHQAAADLLDKQSNIIAAIYAERAGGSVDEWRDLMKAETWYDADEAVAAGLADAVQGTATTSNAVDAKVYGEAARHLPVATVPVQSAPPSELGGDPVVPSDADVAAAIEALEGAFK